MISTKTTEKPADIFQTMYKQLVLLDKTLQHSFFLIAAHSINPWYMQDENAELKFLRRHKDFIAEIKRSSTDTWIQNVTFKDFESECDAYLCLSRCPRKLGLVKECHSCDTILAIYRLTYRCLECKDVDICSDCYFRGEKLSGHSTNHRMVCLRQGSISLCKYYELINSFKLFLNNYFTINT